MGKENWLQGVKMDDWFKCFHCEKKFQWKDSLDEDGDPWCPFCGAWVFDFIEEDRQYIFWGA
jgi:DNA-directed RNA polymerase subunit RPC12/RpoP